MNISPFFLIPSLFLLLSCSSAEQSAVGKLLIKQGADGMYEQQLPACPDKPNCINTEYPEQSSHYIPALDYQQDKQPQALAMAKKIIVNMGGEIIAEEENYLASTFTSSLFRFVDDFEIRQDIDSNKLHIRSASRMGYSDFGVNKRRVEQFSKLFLQQQQQEQQKEDN
ncbi:MAG: DUF1499 domain-containing protein [Pseudomonadota bacterium]